MSEMPYRRSKQDPPIRTRTPVQLRPHPVLYERLVADAKRVGGIPASVAELILSRHYGLDVDGTPLPDNSHDSQD